MPFIEILAENASSNRKEACRFVELLNVASPMWRFFYGFFKNRSI
jgi:hypothetical protein